MVMPNREVRNVPAERWSDWKRGIVRGKGPDRTKRNFKHEGYYCNDIKTVFNDKDCGIYEWKAVRNGRHYVVYIGSTCRSSSCASLQERIMEYCTHGSHIPVDAAINRALRRGYELHVRVKETGVSKKDAEDAENEMLDTYNYAWNTRRNAPYRGNSFPPT